MKNKKTYQVAMPYFSKEDSDWIKSRVDKVLFDRLSTGPFVKEFEEKFAKFVGTKFAVALNSCTSALEISINYLNLKPGDEVIVPVQTFIATGTAVTSQGGKIVFAEINHDTFCLDLNEIKKKVNSKTKAIMLVHFSGYLAYDSLEIKKFCKDKKIFLIEDCAHAVGSSIDGIVAGNIGDVGCFSFFSTKTITTGEGGMLTTNNESLFNLAKSLRERGRDWSHPTEIYDKSWRNCRIPEFSAILGINQLSHIDEIINHRNEVTKIYDDYISKSKKFTTLPRKNNINYSLWKHITLMEENGDREKLQSKLKNEFGININWAYSPALHLQPLYIRTLKNKKGMFPKSEKIMQRHFHLPLHMQISIEDAHFIGQSLLKC